MRDRTVFRFVVGIALLAGGLFSGVLYAVDPAPRISDREIIEGLAEFKVVHERFKAVDAEFKAVRAEIQGVRAEIRQLEKRLDQVWGLLLLVAGGIMGLIGFIIWDRKTAMRPIEQEVQLLKQELDAQRKDAEAFPWPPSCASARSRPRQPAAGHCPQERLAALNFQSSCLSNHSTADDKSSAQQSGSRSQFPSLPA